MADFPPPPVASAAQPPITAVLVAYALYAIAAIGGVISSGLVHFAPLVAIAGIVGVIVAYVKRGDARGTWVESHCTWLIRTFWWSLLWAILGWVILLLLLIVLIGIPIAYAIWFCAGIWVIYRVVRGYLLFKDSKPIPGV